MPNAEGRSYSFDYRGSGYGRGEGCAVVILKTLDEALRCGDPIRGIIRGTAVNQDGKTSGISSSSQMAQEVLLQTVYEKACLDPRIVQYVEAHGTGTSAGDKAEIGVIEAVFCKDRTSPLYVGSVKSNISHLESASGLAGLIKAVLALEKGIVPPNADFQTGESELNLQSHNIIVCCFPCVLRQCIDCQRSLQPLSRSPRLRIAEPRLTYLATEGPTHISSWKRLPRLSK